MSHMKMWMNRVTRMNESCPTYECACAILKYPTTYYFFGSVLLHVSRYHHRQSTVVYYHAMSCGMMQSVAVCWFVLQCIAVSGSLLLGTACHVSY
mmetsp:Transcript_30975/g.50010  ORF Transcript_30975/g.50010 Transcript_30975/m.50010 type:complete len:95 (+) Transcript_30975:506-790(+)